ncbi:hypothetical protein ACVI1J_008979 [Bradyrhizobium diazoefficiens]
MSVSKGAASSLQALQENNFAGETPEQQEAHRAIDRKYRRRNKRRGSKPVPFPRFRKGELERLFAERCGGKTLPDDDAGRDYLRLMADHLAQLSADAIRWWARAWAPWAGDAAELDDLVELVGPGKRWTKNRLAKELNLDNATRTRLDIRTIGAVDRTKAQRKSDSDRRKAERERARRAEAGARPHAMSAAQLKPWLELGISESTFHRRNRKAKIADSDSCRILLESRCDTIHCQGAPPPFRGGSEARAVSGAKSRAVLLAGLDGESLSGTARARVPLTRQRIQPTPAPATRQ